MRRGGLAVCAIKGTFSCASGRYLTWRARNPAEKALPRALKKGETTVYAGLFPVSSDD